MRWTLRDRLGHGGGRLGVLLYHRLSDDARGVPGMVVHPATFQAHMETLARAADVRPLAEAVTAWESGDLRGPTVCVSFDDGYVDNAEIAVPLAERLGIPITIFVTTGALGSPEGFWWDRLWSCVGSEKDPTEFWRIHSLLKALPADDRERRLDGIGGHKPVSCRPMSKEELLAVASREVVSIGSHSVSHPSLAALPPADQEREVRGAKAGLEGLLGWEVPLASYPFGKTSDVSAATREVLASSGHVAAFTSVAGVSIGVSDPYDLPRLSMHESSPEQFAATISATFGARPRVGPGPTR